MPHKLPGRGERTKTHKATKKKATPKKATKKMAPKKKKNSMGY